MLIMRKKKIKLKLIMYAAAALLVICAAASVVGPVREFKEWCASFSNFGDKAEEYINDVMNYYDSLLANLGVTQDELANLPFDSDIIMEAIWYDINGGNIKYKDGQEVFYQSYETKTETTTTTETVETVYKHFDGASKPNKGTFIHAGCDNYSCQIEISYGTGIKLYRYVCNGHTILQEIEHSETLTRYLTYGHYFKIMPSEYMSEYDMPWNVLLAMAVVQKYAYDGGLELDDYDGDIEDFKYKLTKKGIKKIHDMFGSDEGVDCGTLFSYIKPYAIAQEEVNRLKAAGASDEVIESSEEYKRALLTEEDVLLKGTYWYEALDSEHPSLMLVITDVYDYMWHYHYNYDTTKGTPVFVSGSRTSRVENFRKTLTANHYDDDSPDLLIALVEAMPNGDKTAQMLEFLLDYYDTNGTEYTEPLYEGKIYKMKEERCELLKVVNEQID